MLTVIMVTVTLTSTLSDLYLSESTGGNMVKCNVYKVELLQLGFGSLADFWSPRCPISPCLFLLKYKGYFFILL